MKNGKTTAKNTAASEKKFVTNITALLKDFPQWYTDIVLKTELCDYGPVKGTMIIRPYGFALWENIKNEFDKHLKEVECQNAYFPLLIPKSFIEKEKDHVNGFAPELATVTHVGAEALPEHLYIRPTSETIIGNNRQSKNLIDKVAASIILQMYLDERRKSLNESKNH